MFPCLQSCELAPSTSSALPFHFFFIILILRAYVSSPVTDLTSLGLATLRRQTLVHIAYYTFIWIWHNMVSLRANILYNWAPEPFYIKGCLARGMDTIIPLLTWSLVPRSLSSLEHHPNQFFGLHFNNKLKKLLYVFSLFIIENLKQKTF